jgi:RTX calcium-binding nonapeptide repeat (4 copies)
LQWRLEILQGIDTHRPSRELDMVFSSHSGSNYSRRTQVNTQTYRKLTNHVSTKLNALSAALVAGVLTLTVQNTTAATITDGPLVFEYDAKVFEQNNVSIKPLIVGGNKILEITDLVGLQGCAPVGGGLRVRCNVNQIVFLSMVMNDQDDVVFVDESAAVLTGYQLAIDGGTGVDDIRGGTEEDEFIGGSGNDLLIGNGGSDSLHGGLGDDRMIGGTGADFLDGGSGRDNMFGQDGNDTLDGGSFDDRLNGGFGQDVLRGGTGDDTIEALDGEVDSIDCGLGQDFVRADFIDTVDRSCEQVERHVFIP